MLLCELTPLQIFRLTDSLYANDYNGFSLFEKIDLLIRFPAIHFQDLLEDINHIQYILSN